MSELTNSQLSSEEDAPSIRLPEDFVNADDVAMSADEAAGAHESDTDFTSGDDDEYNLEDMSDEETRTPQAAMEGGKLANCTEQKEPKEEGGVPLLSSQEHSEEDSDMENRGERKAGEASTSGQGADLGLAAAFDEILAHPGPANVKHKAPILLASKSLAKRQREETEVTAAQKAAKKLRQEMKQRGHVGVLKKGEDPASDAHEKALYKIATRGVVQLFNAVSKAQRSQKEALASGAKEKDAKISKTSFFDELKGKATQKKPAKLSIGPQEEGTVSKPAERKSVSVSMPVKGWDVLDEGFASLQGSAGLKMKDWDKMGEQEVALDEGLSGSEGDEAVDW